MSVKHSLKYNERFLTLNIWEFAPKKNFINFKVALKISNKLRRRYSTFNLSISRGGCTYFKFKKSFHPPDNVKEIFVKVLQEHYQ